MKGLFWLIVMISPLILIVILFTIAYAEIAIRKYAPMVIKQINRAHNQNIINNGHIEHQTNIAENQTIIQQNKIINNAARDTPKTYIETEADRQLLASAMAKYGTKDRYLPTLDTNADYQEVIYPTYKGIKLSPTIMKEVDDRFSDVLRMHSEGVSITKIIAELFSSTSGERFKRLNNVIRYYLDE